MIDPGGEPRPDRDGAGPADDTRQMGVTPERLLTVLLVARKDMREALAIRPPDVRRQELARAQLLAALEAYASGLTARGLSAPPALRDELALQRSLAR